MQSTSGATTPISSSRSAASNRRACSTVSAPASSAASQALRSDFDQPVAAVHHTRSPGRTPIQRSVCSRFASTYPRRCSAPFGPPSVPEVNSRNAGASAASAERRRCRIGERQVARLEQCPHGARARDAVGHVALRQQLGAGQGHGADPPQGAHRDQPLERLPKPHQDGVAHGDTGAGEARCGTIGELVELGRPDRTLRPALVDDQSPHAALSLPVRRGTVSV